MLTMAGRVIIINSVLNSLPIYFLSIFKIPRWVIKRIDKVRRDFLWHGDIADKHKIKFLNWASVCQTKENGGLDIKNLSHINMALLAKWAWKFYESKEGLWAKFARQIYQYTPVPNVITPNSASPLMRDIHKVMSLFNNFIRFGGNFRDNILFWKHNWMGERLEITFPNLHSFFDSRQNISVNDAFNLEDWTTIFNLPLSTVALAELDELTALWDVWIESNEERIDNIVTWSLQNDGKFSTSSVYTILAGHPKVKVTYSYIWKLRIPPKLRIFVWRLVRNILPTLDQLSNRGCILPNICLLCMADAESVLHLFQECQFASAVFSTLALQGIQTLRTFRHNGDLNLRVRMAASCFWIWKERCARTFRDETSSVQTISESIKADLDFWSRVL